LLQQPGFPVAVLGNASYHTLPSPKTPAAMMLINTQKIGFCSKKYVFTCALTVLQSVG
jgi:hypothetical protein